MFSLNFSLAGRGSFIAGNAKKKKYAPQSALFRGQGGGGVRDMTLSLMGNLGAKSTSLILANLQAIAGSKFYRLPPDKENTAGSLSNIKDKSEEWSSQ